MKTAGTRYLPIQLKPLQMEDFPAVEMWSKDNAFCHANGWEIGRNKEELYSWWYNCVHNAPNDFLRLGIQYESRLIGYVDLANIHGNSAEIGIAIGESKVWGHGVGPEAVKQFMIYATEKFGIQLFDAETHEANTRSKNMLQKLGFIEISRIGFEKYMGIESQLIQYRYNKGE